MGKSNNKHHHSNKKKKKGSSVDVDVDVGEESLKRFAGSSDEDEGIDNDDEDVESDQEEREGKNNGWMKRASSSSSRGSGGGGHGRKDTEDDSDVEEAEDDDADDDESNNDNDDEGDNNANDNDDDIPTDGYGMDKKTKSSSSTKKKVAASTSHDDDDDDDDDSSSVEGIGGGGGVGIGIGELDTAAKMADVMGKILGVTTSKNKKGSGNSSTSVVLGKTVTPLQRLQQQEKDKLKQMSDKRQANRERNLSALHLPLSIATTNNIFSDGQAQLSVVKELEQERYHRRVATRGVVALFNAISQHQRTGGGNPEDESNSTNGKRNKETTKLTKHGFLDKIKSTAKAGVPGSSRQGSDDAVEGGDQKNNTERDPTKRRRDGKETSTNKPSWFALKDDYMLNPKKNWDEESSDEEDDSPIMEDPDFMATEPAETPMTDSKRKRQKRVSRE